LQQSLRRLRPEGCCSHNCPCAFGRGCPAQSCRNPDTISNACANPSANANRYAHGGPRDSSYFGLVWIAVAPTVLYSQRWRYRHAVIITADLCANSYSQANNHADTSAHENSLSNSDSYTYEDSVPHTDTLPYKSEMTRQLI